MVINADDFGLSESVNEAIRYAFEHRHINRTTLMVTHPYAGEAMQIARENGFIEQVGLHLNLDTGHPLTKDILKYNLYSKSGKDRTSFWYDKRINRIIIVNPMIKEAIREEVEAQMKRYLELGGTNMHIDSHHHRHLIPSVLPIIIKSAKEYGFKTMRIAWNYHQGMSRQNLFVKKIINAYVKRSFSTTDIFCCYDDYLINPIKGVKTVEIMVHPDVIGGKYVDVIDREKGILNDLNSYILLSNL